MMIAALAAALWLFPTDPPPRAELPTEDAEATVYFDYGATELGSVGLQLVRETAATALASGYRRVRVTGHTDTAGPAAQNLIDGEARAEAVALVLIAAGFDPDNVEIESAGESDPVINYADERREPRNRRAVIVFLAE